MPLELAHFFYRCWAQENSEKTKHVNDFVMVRRVAPKIPKSPKNITKTVPPELGHWQLQECGPVPVLCEFWYFVIYEFPMAEAML